MSLDPKKYRITVVTGYPISDPRHGGQIRVAEVVKVYAKAGFRTNVIAIFNEDSYPDRDPQANLTVPAKLPGSIDPAYDLAYHDLLAGLHCLQDPATFSRLASMLLAFDSDVIQLEQPFLWPAVKRILNRSGASRRPLVVYSSQNIEHEMKAECLKSMGAPVSCIQRVHSLISDQELELIGDADLIFCVTHQDLSALRELGASAEKLFLAPNGVREFSTAVAQARPKQLGNDPFALFISSAHLPNSVGFFTLLGDAFGFLPPDRQLVIAGGVTEFIRQTPEFRRWAGLNNSRVKFLGSVSLDTLRYLYQAAHLIILPITSGGGSNIKTAEAIAANAYVLGTSVAFRGFEEFKSEPGVFVEDGPVDFRRRMVSLLESPPFQPDETARVKRSTLHWGQALRGMPEVLLSRLGKQEVRTVTL